MAITDEIPKSRLTLTYRTEVSGEPEDKALPFRLLVMGDLALEETKNGTTSSNEHGTDLDARIIRDLNGNNLDSVMSDLGTRLKFTVPNRIDEGGKEVAVDLKLDSMKAFQPSSIVENVEPLRALKLLKKLLLEVQANMDNRKEFRTLIRELNELKKNKKAGEAVTAVLAELENLGAAAGGFDAFKVPAGAAAKSEDAADDSGSDDTKAED